MVESTENVETHLDHDLKSQFKRDPNALDQTLNTVDVIDEDVEMSIIEATQAVTTFSLEAPRLQECWSSNVTIAQPV